MDSKDILFKIALTKIPLVGAITAKNLLAYCGSAEQVFKEKKESLTKIPGVGELIVKRLREAVNLKTAETELKFIEKNNITVLSQIDSQYPWRLKHQDDSPFLLYYKGNADLNQERIISIVGTRNPTEYGIRFLEQFIEEIKAFNIQVISGLAFGIDAVAHRLSVTHDIPTVGVLAHGLDMLYPSQHVSLSEKMLSNGGLLTEYPSNTNPDRENFPRRNRIVAGMCDALVVVETAEEGGSMITAAYANDYNKDVFALPGKITDTFSQGCNLLLRLQRAHVITKAKDLSDLLRWTLESPSTQSKIIQPSLFIDLEGEEKLIYEILQKNNEVHVDILHQNLDISPSILAAKLLSLEMKGIIKSLPGKRYKLF